MSQAMIFAAGLGTRLKPLTDTMPKALVPYHGVPMLERVVGVLKDGGFDDIVVNVHHFADQIDAFIAEHNQFGIRVRTSDERDLLRETGGGIRHAAHLFNQNEPVLLHNVDIESNLDYSKLLSFHNNGDIATLIVSQRDTSRYLLFDRENRLVGWTNVSTGEVKTPYSNLDISECRKYAFSGIHIISPSIFPLMKDWPEKFSIIDFYLSICKDFQIKGFPVENLVVKDLGKKIILDEE